MTPEEREEADRISRLEDEFEAERQHTADWKHIAQSRNEELEALRTKYEALRAACKAIQHNWFFGVSNYDDDYAVHRMFTVLEDQNYEDQP